MAQPLRPPANFAGFVSFTSASPIQIGYPGRLSDVKMDEAGTNILLYAKEGNIIMQNDTDILVPDRNSHYTNPKDLEAANSVRSTSSGSSADAPNPDPVKPRRALLPTGCCYDPRMKLHANADFSGQAHHPEDPERIQAIIDTFRKHDLLFTGTVEELAEIQAKSPYKYMTRIEARPAQEAEICTVHTIDHFNWVASLSKQTGPQLRSLTTSFDMGRKSLYVGALTYEAALISAGAAIETCRAVMSDQCKNAIAVIRPPGHHAEHNESLGFCIFNNVAVAAKCMQQEFPQKCRKILILDWDVHHGNGVQNIFYEDPNVLYISLHVYANGSFYPGQPEDEDTPDGGMQHCGALRGVGRNVNIGWVEQGVGDAEYMAAFHYVVMPIATEFNPDFVIISAGFDAAAGDDLGGCYVSPAAYSHMTHQLMSLANGKVVACLEGGYNLHAISRSSLAVTRTLMGEPPEAIDIPPINEVSVDTLNTVKRLQAPYWECMRPGDMPAIDKSMIARSTPLTTALRMAQQFELNAKFSMVPLTILKTSIYEMFENQVLVTPNFIHAKRMLLILHDPPSVYPVQDEKTHQFYPHNTRVSDSLLPYLQWAYDNDFAIMDVNFPEEGTAPHNPPGADWPGFLPKADDGLLAHQRKLLLCYLWDNYLELKGVSSIAILGVGNAYAGVKQLLIARDGATSRIPAILCFTDGTLSAIKSETDPTLSHWYKDHTQIYVNPDHPAWKDESYVRRLEKRRFGAVIKGGIQLGMSDGLAVTAMMDKHFQESTEWLVGEVQTWEEENWDGDETEGEEVGAGGEGGMFAGAGGDGDVEMAGTVSSRMPILG